MSDEDSDFLEGEPSRFDEADFLEFVQRGPAKIDVVTGASAGLGERFARVLHAAGANVVVGARRADRIEDLARSLGDGHGDVVSVVVLWTAFTVFMLLRGACRAWRIRGDAWAVLGAEHPRRG